MPVVGHSMEPTLMDGTMIYYRRATWEEVIDNDIVICYSHAMDELKVRRALCQGNKRCVLVADNPEHAERIPLNDEVVVVAIVLYADNGTIGGGANKPCEK
jgi:phage repressor protein C with HTH and peptisase S24 domain